MRRLDTFTIIIIAVCLIAAGLLIWVGYKKLSGDDAADDKSALYEEIEKNDDYYYLDEEEEDDTTQDGFANTETNDAEVDDPQNTSTYSNDDYDVVEETPSSSGGKLEDTDEVPNSYSSGGAYMVLAGSFKIRANADSYAKKLRNKGYSNTSVERFDKGTFAVVMVDRFNSLSEAKSLVSRLKGDGIDSFVKKK
ncbi:MAG: SPOR domain-containing protein [Bacteroidota bacterium]